MINCTGSMIKGTACFKCSRCDQKQKALLKKYFKTPLSMVPKKDVLVFSLSIQLVAMRMGPSAFKDFLEALR